MAVEVHRYHDYQTGHYTRVPNDALSDARLSHGARGVLAFLLGRPPGWVTSAERLAAMSDNGVHACRAFLRELVDAGYLVRQRVKDAAGHFIMRHLVADQPGHTRDLEQLSMFTETLDPRADLIAAHVEKRRTRPTPTRSSRWTRSPKQRIIAGQTANQFRTVGPSAHTSKREDKQAAPADAEPAPERVRRAAMGDIRALLAEGGRRCRDVDPPTRRSRPPSDSAGSASNSTGSSGDPTTCVSTAPS